MQEVGIVLLVVEVPTNPLEFIITSIFRAGLLVEIVVGLVYALTTTKFEAFVEIYYNIENNL
jgi:hypothetical protein